MATSEVPVFEKELETYEAHRDELMCHLGKFALIRGNEVVGVWDTYEDALRAGYDRCGLESPFLVKKIEGLDGIQYFTRDI